MAEASSRGRGIAARIWCDPDMANVVMDVDKAEEIAKIIDEVIANNTQETSQSS